MQWPPTYEDSDPADRSKAADADRPVATLAKQVVFLTAVALVFWGTYMFIKPLSRRSGPAYHSIGVSTSPSSPSTHHAVAPPIRRPLHEPRTRPEEPNRKGGNYRNRDSHHAGIIPQNLNLPIDPYRAFASSIPFSLATAAGRKVHPLAPRATQPKPSIVVRPHEHG